MIAAILDELPMIAVSILLGLWIAHILGMWASLFKREGWDG